MRIGLDVMGGDYAPERIISGAILAYKELKDSAEIVLIGPEKIIIDLLKKHNADFNCFSIENCSEVIEMCEDPVKAFYTKTDSGIVKGFSMLKSNTIQGFASAGNSGALMVGATRISNTLEGVIRPCISSLIPNTENSFNVLLDVGINVDCSPEQLYQFGIIGSIYAQLINNKPNPKVGLLNIGSEAIKGNKTVRKTYELMNESNDFAFYGNIEGNEIFDGKKADVIVTDGFTGNIVLKQAESFYTLTYQNGSSNSFTSKFNFELYGGTPVLGINHNLVIGHGINNDIATKNMIIQTKELYDFSISANIKKMLSYEKN
jgi:phosphate acyltransferase